jgi:hypothetical protein
VLRLALAPAVGQIPCAFVFGSVAQGREVNPKVYTPEEFAALANSNAFLLHVLAKPKIWLIGEDRDLAELVGAEP